MEIKWFFVIIGLFLTFAILTGMYFITNFALLQQQKYYEDSQKTAIQRFDNSTLVHDFLFKNITDLKKGLDPILATIKNATEMKRQQQEHYNQTTEDFKRIQQVLQIKLLDHITLQQVNQTVNQIAQYLFNQTTSSTDNGTIIVVDNTTKPIPPTPIPSPIVVNDSGVIVENITGKNNSSDTLLR
jgi:hypothetical protein